jgi:hypothetical protein
MYRSERHSRHHSPLLHPNRPSSCSVSACTRVGVVTRRRGDEDDRAMATPHTKKRPFLPLAGPGADHERRGEAGLQAGPRRVRRRALRRGRADQRRHVDVSERARRAPEPPPQEAPRTPLAAAAQADDLDLTASAPQPAPPHPASRLDVAWSASHDLACPCVCRLSLASASASSSLLSCASPWLVRLWPWGIQGPSTHPNVFKGKR